MLETIEWRQFLEWQRYYAVEPFGEERADLRAAIVASSLVNAWGGKSKIEDFMPQYDEAVAKTQPMTPERWQAFKSSLKAGAGAG